MSDAKKDKFAVNVERRRWDVQEYERKAVEDARKKAAETDAPVLPKTSLRARESTPLSLGATLGKSILVAANTPLNARGGYYCDVCLCLLKDSQTYLDHINGRKHQKKLGMSMKVEKVEAAEVRDRVRQWAERREAEKGDREAGGRKRKRADGDERKEEAEDDEDDGEDERVKTEGGVKAEERKDGAEQQADGSSGSKTGSTNEERGKSSRGERAVKLERTAEEDEEESDMAAMGFNFAAFGGSKKT